MGIELPEFSVILYIYFLRFTLALSHTDSKTGTCSVDVALLFLALRSPGLNVQWSYFTLT